MQIIGILLVIFGIVIFNHGIKYKDPSGSKISNINFIGSALLLIIIGIAFFLSERTLCEIFGIFC